MITIEVPEEVVQKVQKADIEQAARKEIIAHILEKGLDVSPERFNAYQADYDAKFFAFEQAKQEIERDFVRVTVKNPKNWTLDYHTKILSIEE